MGPAPFITSTSSGRTSRSSESMRRSRSSWSSNTTARPRWRRRSGDAAVCFRTAPVGAREPRTTARPPSSCTGESRVRMTLGLWTAAPAMLSPRVWPVTVGVSSSSRGDISFSRAARPPALKKSSIRKRPDGFRSSRNGVDRDSSSKRSRSSSMPARPAMAVRWTTALVEPPSACSALMALRSEGSVTKRAGVSPRRARSTMRRPACSPSWRRRESAAGMSALPGRAMPSVSQIAAMVDAVPMTPQWPGAADDRALQVGPVVVGDPARAELLLVAAAVGAGAQLLAAPACLELGAAGDHDGGHVRADRAHQHRGGRLVAAGQEHHAVERVGADRLLDVHAHQVAVEHGGGAHVVLAQGHDGELEGDAAGLRHAALHGLADGAEVGVAVGQLAPGAAYADDRAAVEGVLAEALGAEGGAPQPAV